MPLAGDPVANPTVAMRGQSIPDQKHWALFDLIQLAQEFDQRFIVVGARTQFKEEVSIAAIGFVRQGTSQRQPFPGEARVSGPWVLRSPVPKATATPRTRLRTRSARSGVVR